VPLFRPYTFLKTFLCHILSISSICSDIVHPSQPYTTTGLITLVYKMLDVFCHTGKIKWF
jgi:hypothetical protein